MDSIVIYEKDYIEPSPTNSPKYDYSQEYPDDSIPLESYYTSAFNEVFCTKNIINIEEKDEDEDINVDETYNANNIINICPIMNNKNFVQVDEESDSLIVEVENNDEVPNVTKEKLLPKEEAQVMKLMEGEGNFTKFNPKFRTQIMLDNSYRKKLKKSRKFKRDDMRKRLKTGFHKTMRTLLNIRLKKDNTRKSFSFLPQCFMREISYEINHSVIKLTYLELLTKKFEIGDEKDTKRYEENKKVIDYLIRNDKITENSEIGILLKMRYCDLLNYYFNSKLFEKSIEKMRNKMKSEMEPQLINEYIDKYLLTANSYVEYFVK